MDIKILGSGCANCQNLETADPHRPRRTRPRRRRSTRSPTRARSSSWGVMTTPALVIDDEVGRLGPGPGTRPATYTIEDNHGSAKATGTVTVWVDTASADPVGRPNSVDGLFLRVSGDVSGVRGGPVVGQ